MDPQLKYKCSECGEVHDDHYEAEECCKPEVYDVYACPICKSNFDDIDEAMECIESCAEEKGVDPLMATKEELERAGQEKLF